MKYFLSAIALCLLSLGGGYLFWLKPQLDAIDAPGRRGGELSFEVPSGATQKNVIQRLAQAGLVEDWRILYAYARYAKLRPPKAGEYAFGATASLREILDKMARGEVQLYSIGFPEGLTYKEIAARLEPTGFVKAAELVTACEDAAFLRANKVSGATCEGYVFPDTYKFAKGKTTRELLAMFIARHHEVFAKVVAPVKSPLSPQQIVTLASIVEKETGVEQERPHIAGLFLNRLQKGMRLETDPTVIYAVSLARGGFDGNIHKADLQLDHPYNTYKRPGLPPGPISNPGQKALEAVVKPMVSSDLFFVSKNDGTHVFCPTLECHEAQVEKWQRQYFKKKKKKA